MAATVMLERLRNGEPAAVASLDGIVKLHFRFRGVVRTAHPSDRPYAALCQANVLPSALHVRTLQTHEIMFQTVLEPEHPAWQQSLVSKRNIWASLITNGP